MSTETDKRLWRMGGGELAGAIRARRVSAREVVQAHLERIDDVNPRVNAVTRTLAGEALAAADAADRRQAEGGELGPLHGVPITIKQTKDVAGSPTTSGVVAPADAVPGIDSPDVAHLRSAGAIPIGRTNTPEFELGWHADNPLYGATLNPWEPTRTPGGSSGGEAVALATGMSPLGLGSDLVASLTFPAQCNGICSLRPTPGRVPYATVIEPVDPPISIQLMAVEGPMARHVSDLRVAFSIMSRPSSRDPWQVPAPLTGPPLLRAPRVALVVDPAGQGVSPQVAAGVRRAAEGLAAAGYAVEEVEPPEVLRAAGAFLDLLLADLQILWPHMSPLGSADANRFISGCFDLHHPVDAATHLQAFLTRRAVARAWAAFQDEHPLILAPVATEPPFAVGADLDPDPDHGLPAILRSMRMTLAVSLLGVPALAVPAGIGDGLPQVVQVVGPRFREDLCLAAGEAIESARGELTLPALNSQTPQEEP